MYAIRSYYATLGDLGDAGPTLGRPVGVALDLDELLAAGGGDLLGGQDGGVIRRGQPAGVNLLVVQAVAAPGGSYNFV